MSKQTKTMIIVLTVLSILIGYNVIFFINKGKKNAAPQASKARQTASAARVPSKARAVVKDPPQVHYISFPAIRGEWGREPFLLPVEIQENRPYSQIEREEEVEDKGPDLAAYSVKLEAFQLTGILFNPSRPIAIINDQLYRVGSTLDATFTITEILRDCVIVSADGHTFRITLPAGKLK